MCILDWTTRYPDIRWNVILDVFVRVFLDEINTWVIGVRSRLSSRMWVVPSSLWIHYILKKGSRMRNWPLLLFVSLLKLRHRFSLALKLGFTPSVSLVPRLSDVAWDYTLGSPQSPACKWQIPRLLSFHNCMSPFLITYQYRYWYGYKCIGFSGEP